MTIDIGITKRARLAAEPRGGQAQWIGPHPFAYEARTTGRVLNAGLPYPADVIRPRTSAGQQEEHHARSSHARDR